MSTIHLSDKSWREISQILSFFASVYSQEPTAEYCHMLSALFDSQWDFEFQSKDAELSYKNLQAIQDYNELNMIVEYNKLFVSAQPILTPPWASVYLNKNGEVFDDETIAVRKFYQKCGLTYEKTLKEPEDHMGLELIFCSYMSAKIAQMEDNTHILNHKVNLITFLENHLIPWADYFFGLVSLKSSHPFYQNIATLTNDYLKYLTKTLHLTPTNRTIYDHYNIVK